MQIPSFSSSKNIKTSIFYVNDVHGNAKQMEKIEAAALHFNNNENRKDKNTDILKLCSGDTLIGANDKKNSNAIDFLNTVKFDAITLGNHEMDNPMSKAAEYYRKITPPIITSNLVIPKNHIVNNEVITTSYVKEINGNKYGFLGIQPFDIASCVTAKEWLEGIDALNKEKTIEKLQTEIDKLEKQGVNKIILLSHSGFEAEKEIAQKTKGIDIIIGGHSHDEIHGINKNEDGKYMQNLFYAKDGKPVIITQGYKNGKYFGVLDVEFDDKGIIKSAKNTLNRADNYSGNLLLSYHTDKNLGKPSIIGSVIGKHKMPTNGMLEENPYANILTDAMRTELKTDIAILNSGNLRGSLNPGKITDRDVSEITPFKNEMTIIKLNQKDLVDAFKFSGKSFLSSDMKPGLLQVSGMKYTMNRKGELLNLSIIKDGKDVPIDINNPDKNVVYSVAIDNYYASGRENFSMLNKINEKDTQIFPFDKDKLAIDYIKKQQTIEIKPEGRITII